jgi:hypothetical protein
MSTPVVAVVVSVGAVPLAHLTDVNTAVLEPVASCVHIRMNDLPAVAVGMVNVQLPVMVTVCTVPLVRDRVCVVPELPIATTDST